MHLRIVPALLLALAGSACEAEPKVPSRAPVAAKPAAARLAKPSRVGPPVVAERERKRVLERHKPTSLEPALHIGSKAPELAIQGWLKGPKISAEMGTILVVENWATWCRPCIEAMPHLSALAARYRSDGLRILAINVQDDGLSSVRSFVKEREDEMNYSVAYDDSGTMSARWIERAGLAGLPASFIVGRDGKIAWLGHPTQLDSVVPAIVEGTWNAQQARREAERKRLLVPYSQAAVSLLASDADAAYELIRVLLSETFAGEPEFLEGLAYHIFAAPNVLRRDLELAYSAASMAGALGAWSEPSPIELMSKIREGQGRIDDAISLQTYAAKIASSSARMEDRLQQLHLRRRETAREN